LLILSRDAFLTRMHCKALSKQGLASLTVRFEGPGQKGVGIRMNGPCGHLLALWITLFTRIAADACLCVLVARQATRQSADDCFWGQAVPFFIAPAVLLALLIGAISNSFPKRRVLVVAAAWCLPATALVILGMSGAGNDFVVRLGLALAGSGAAVYWAAVFGLVPAVARDSRLPPGRVTAAIGSAVWAGLAAGVLLGWNVSSAIAVVLGLNIASLLAALFNQFASDACRRVGWTRAVSFFLSDAVAIARDRQSRKYLLALVVLLAVAISAFVISVLRIPDSEPSERRGALFWELILGCGGAMAGSLLAGAQGHLLRALGLVPYGATLLVAGVVGEATGADARWPCLLLGLAAGLISVPLAANYLSGLLADARGNGAALMNAVGIAVTLALSGLLASLIGQQVVTATAALWSLFLLVAAATAWAWYAFLREALEQLSEIILWPFYRVKVHGPGFEALPRQGPVLIIANHAAWFDPLWLAKVTPRQVTPMMTSVFYDLPILRLLMEKVVHAIRVQASSFRREAPELDLGIEVLDKGGCLVIFPEGFVKRRPEQLLHPFGQGIWRILSQRPDTPVVACWIEGGWGSFTSHCGSPPMVRKRIDWRRPIDIGVDAPQVLNRELLADNRATRKYLMQACLKARSYLGLQSPAENQIKEEDGPEEDNGE